MTKIIGLTGGIGSGKTTIANYFQSFGIPVYIADDEARKIMQSSEIIDAIKKVFGNSVFENDVLSREKLAEIVFNGPEKLEELNKIIHPAVKRHFDQWLLQHAAAPYIIYEAAILFESGNYKRCDLIITVTTPVESRIQRVLERDKTTRELVLKRINAQWTDEQRISKSDFVIENTSIEAAKLEVVKILKILKIKQNES
ncbi:dephospho-CoA kinase [Flavobacterium gawalongense]|uniref:Dephospho-CoA kinase n=1 Tax=Flavobacterium gawalongense TaxID=2594432 RepID=A0A553BRY3_9FLAO|nr:dephospho-CoA kinase [Flavobacterium gawalongense]TRX03115.1 dephospho-CoA kinase [Flavobacterium gawalongense]TRX09777.1 dephospho-CoA kinase [Flavobacterium gawalongense]TRX11003.1 dephospho-CoA kinase [Flavobacterium gawalongense]TRX12034.1 dephospho-CoA kinase [Flavobacterium gawalongense]TRX29880.1 dephospho-CoA kinase [Flavobacterium gawalongense]